MPTETEPQELPVDLPEPWATRLRLLAEDMGISPDEMLALLVDQQVGLRQAARRLHAPWLSAAPKA